MKTKWFVPFLRGAVVLTLVSHAGCVIIPVVWSADALSAGKKLTTRRDVFLIEDSDKRALMQWAVALPNDEIEKLKWRHPTLGRRMLIHFSPKSFEDYRKRPGEYANRGYSENARGIVASGTTLRMNGIRSRSGFSWFFGMFTFEYALSATLEDGDFSGLEVDIQDVVWKDCDLYFRYFPILFIMKYNLDDNILKRYE